MPDIRYYVAASGEEPFAEWFMGLDAAAGAKVARALARWSRAISPTSKVLEKACSNIGSILAQAIGFILGEMVG